MATYFHGSSEIQADTLQTLYLMNPSNYSSYSDTQQHQQQQANMFFLNSAAGNALHNASISHAPPPQNHHFVGIPLSTVGSTNSDDPNRPSVHEIPTLHGMVPRFHYNLWNSVDQTTAGATVASNSGDVLSQLGFRRPVVAVSPNTTAHQQQGLSLSLNSSQNPGFRSLAGEHEISGQPPPASSDDDVRGSGGSPSSVSNGISSLQSVILGSKYLKAAQQVLDEVVNVGKEIKLDTGEGSKEKMKMKRESTVVTGGCDGSTGGESSVKSVAELTAAQRQEIQMKKAKLVNMLDEVEQRYRQYHHQMQRVVSSFEQAAGIGSAKSYTALALQTISKQFRCLKDVITAQIKATNKSLGEDDSSGVKAEGSRLKFVDQELRQQRALQQFGMIQVQHNAWRPQRGLPEKAVSVLRAWLFEHFLHPYPKDSDKHMLAKQTGLTRGQVSNWFINARVRLWKPMVEEMYMEEMKDQEQNGSENKESGSKSTAVQENSSFQMDQTQSNTLKSKQEKPINHNSSPTEISNLTASTPPLGGSVQPQTDFTSLMRSSDMEGIGQRSPKKPRNSDKQNSPSSILSMDMDTKSRGETDKGIKNSYSFGMYPIGEIERFDHEQLATTGYHNQGSGFSLTLGLPHCENLTHQQNYLSNNQSNIQLGSRLNMGTMESHYNGIINSPQQASHSNTGYESINIQDRKRFAAQLLHDFVA
ncbi:BEL1-like homeodomain protein 1 [Camellia lanceoleosa]|uniref:BEL1-like homeodomain protein 1 n=1 Tax=Camellia lanceoleosa TaxID=1840588 RepID=A0ACC0FUW4_9ERIC|nr:BEL1-like homeodomain protein 1 [Camellia lanceoleosa]